MLDVSDRRAEGVGELGSLRLRKRRDGDRHIIALAGELDFATTPAVEHELERVEGTGARVIVLDLRELEFIDSSGVEVILMAHRRDAHSLVVVKGPRLVQRVFEICDLVRELSFVDDPLAPPRASGC